MQDLLLLIFWMMTLKRRRVQCSMTRTQEHTILKVHFSFSLSKTYHRFCIETWPKMTFEKNIIWTKKSPWGIVCVEVGKFQQIQWLECTIYLMALKTLSMNAKNAKMLN